MSVPIDANRIWNRTKYFHFKLIVKDLAWSSNKKNYSSLGPSKHFTRFSCVLWKQFIDCINEYKFILKENCCDNLVSAQVCAV